MLELLFLLQKFVAYLRLLEKTRQCPRFLCHVSMEYSIHNIDNGSELGAYVPSFDSVVIPCASLCWFLMDEDFGTKGSNRRSIVIKITI